jgi:hypothetical protein
VVLLLTFENDHINFWRRCWGLFNGCIIKFL